jgi:hypothetical protein
MYIRTGFSYDAAVVLFTSILMRSYPRVNEIQPNVDDIKPVVDKMHKKPSVDEI